MLGLSACAADGAQGGLPIAQRDEPIVYGKDDRLDVYEHPDPALRELARASVVALVPRALVEHSSTGGLRLTAPSLGDAYGLCQDEHYLAQPVASDCSGVLIDSDLVLTAAHCFNDVECADYHYVFDYFYRAPGELEPLGANDVYNCQQLVARQLPSASTGAAIDFAVVQLDRPVSGRLPVTVRETPLAVGEPLSVLGTGSGLPIKIDDQARVVAPRSQSRDFFSLESDTFKGSSGSGVFDADELLVGVLVRGGPDYVRDITADCKRVNRPAKAVEGELADGGLGHEEATYVSPVLEQLCEQKFPSPSLCGIQPSCGDGFCSSDESRLDCLVDCEPCDAGACGARGDSRFAAGEPVIQTARPRTDRTQGCALDAGAGSSWALALLALVLRRINRQTI